MTARPPAPRTFYLNERHELTPGEVPGGGSLPKYAPVDWGPKAARLHGSLERVRSAVAHSPDPLRDRRYYVVALPEPTVQKLSIDKRLAPSGTYDAEPRYAAEQSLEFSRLGMDLLDVHGDGRATVHATADRFEHLLATTQRLPEAGARERARWMTLREFDEVPLELKVNDEWLAALQSGVAVDAIIELQPLLSRAECQEVVRAIGAALGHASGGSRALAEKADFSGRFWLKARLTRAAIETIAGKFPSVQAIHPPLRSEVDAPTHPRRATPRRDLGPGATVVPRAATAGAPCVAVVDTGVPDNHPYLHQFRRPGGYRLPDAQQPYWGDHGSFVASRLVYGDLDLSGGVPRAMPPGTCTFLDVMVAEDPGHIYDKELLAALDAVVATSPDVRVFNLSFGGKVPIEALDGITRRQRLALLQDLDNFIFARDVLVVVAAGNSVPGAVPATPYPDHLDDPSWRVGTWASGFNTLTCGASVERVVAGGVVTEVGWPSPFTRLGPGLAEAPVPDFGAHGGNGDHNYGHAPGLGVWGCTANGTWEDKSGSSYAAPLLARDAAFLLRDLQAVCPPGVRPFCVTAKAFLALTAERFGLPGRHEKLERRALGLGRRRPLRLVQPLTSSAVFVWQGVVRGTDAVARVEVPIPRVWLRGAGMPTLRVACSWDAPAHAAVQDLWACRRVDVRLRAPGISRAVPVSRSRHRSYPLYVVKFDIDPEKLEEKATTQRINADSWHVEIAYRQTAAYYPGINFAPEQRVALAMELLDESETATSPQAAVQALPVAQTMTRLGILTTPVAVPIRIRP
ncbi:MAG: S8 family serine peptidase [Polyangiaceae bacterium]|nr:S8 family serine peptidase [Polyangiaceae bacterium]